ncbi:hypothetical protein An16g07100 [Aspergillus niger]|uniref:Uncharacterized protein n=2 Tax=Aspergillus niger TaxID=5061 RepID=A2R8G8_ASPNC|nr:hypothetical protein An16g07100 [Aspergillus niger]CAL00483.1 hypothetical protein An16g07100 [Aspergillus niger]
MGVKLDNLTGPDNKLLNLAQSLQITELIITNPLHDSYSPEVKDSLYSTGNSPPVKADLRAGLGNVRSGEKHIHQIRRRDLEWGIEAVGISHVRGSKYKVTGSI